MAEPRWTVHTHGYGGYSSGCRCDICRTAKATYMREKRHEATLSRLHSVMAGEVYIAPDITHGTISGFLDAKCRCRDCRRAGKAARVRFHRRAGAR